MNIPAFVACMTFLFGSIAVPGVALQQHKKEITLEYAITHNEQMWGLMGRDELPEDHGMLFVYETPQKVSFWMFGCRVDLSVAFLDEEGVIQEIHDMPAYPGVMDRERPVVSLEDMALYSYDEPIVRFFHEKEIVSHIEVSRALEMKKGWFEENGVRVGDKIICDYDTKSGLIF
jgi:uncharacterized protein